MRVDSNIVLGQRLVGEGKMRMHWLMDEEFYPVKPSSKVNLERNKPVIPVSEKWLKGKKENFEAFTIPYYDFVYMKDLEEPNESYIVQPFGSDLVVIDIDINENYIEDNVLGTEESSFVYLPEGDKGKLIEDFKVIAGLDFDTKTAYDEDKVKGVDLKVGFNGVWKEDLEKLVEAFYYTLSVTEASLQSAVDKGNTSEWGTDIE